MSLMGSLYIGASGLQTGQNALNTTAHNMTNAETIGYTRQMVQQATRSYNTISKNGSAVAMQQTGLGVFYAETKTARDVFLDKSYRKESGRSSFYEVTTNTVEEIENLLQELEGEDFGKSLENLWASVQALANEPSAATAQGVFVRRCQEFLARADAVYQGLSDYQNNTNNSIKGDIDEINRIGKEISKLNSEILKVEAGQIERANDMRDRRNKLLDDLGKLANISIQDDAFGNVNVKIEGTDFVKSDSVNEIALYQDEKTGFYTPYWSQLAKTETVGGVERINIDGAQVFDLSMEISTAMNTDVGKVKSKLLARGDHRATYKDIQDPVHYEKNISQSLLMNVQAEFDQLVNKVATGINDILEQAALAETAVDPNSTYLRDSNGKPLRVFDLISNPDGYTVKNMTINKELQQAPSLLGFVRKGTGEDRETTEKLKNLFSEEKHVLNPNTATQVNLTGYYNSLVAQVGGTGEVSRAVLNNQEETVKEVEAAREQVIGVARDEEMSNMVMFQNAYNASSRYINVISEMLEHIITTLGRG